MSNNKRSGSQVAADARYEEKRAKAPRFGGRCTNEEKDLLIRLSSREDLTEKELIFRALKFFEENA